MKTEETAIESLANGDTLFMEGAPTQAEADVPGTSLAETALAASREFVHRFWNADVRGCKAMLAPELVWIGAGEGQLGQGTESFCAMHAELVGESSRVILMNEEYRAIPSSGSRTVAVACQYVSYTDLFLSSLSALHQRVTLIWRARPEGMRLVHCHLSSPLDRPSAGATLSTAALSGARVCLSRLSEQAGDVCAMRDVDGGLHYLRLPDVMYLEARKQSTVVHCTMGSFRLRDGIGVVAELLDSQGSGRLVTVHRSYVVNAIYVASIGRNTVSMANGEELSLSTRRRDEVLAQMELLHQGD